MKRQLDTATEAPPELQNHDGADSTPEVLTAPELFKANDVALQAPGDVAVSVLERQAARTQPGGLLLLQLLWTKRQITMQWALAGFWGAILLTLVIPKQYVSTSKLMPPEAYSANKLSLQELTGGLGSMAGDLLGVSSSGALLISVMRSRTVEDRMVDKFNLKKVYRVGLQEKARTRLEVKTSFSEEPKTGMVVLSVTDSDPQRAAAMVRAYVEELDTLMSKLNNSSARREREFLQDRLKVVKLDMESAEKELSEFASKNAAMGISEQVRVMVENEGKLQGELIAAESQLEEVRQIYTDSSPQVRSLQARISELVNQQKKLLGTYRGKAFVDGEAPVSSFPTLRQLPILGVPYESKFRKLKMEEAVYETLRAEFDSAKVQEARENPAVEVLDFPEVPERQSFPPRLLIIATGTGCAVILSGVWILGVARWRQIDAQHAGMVSAREIFGTVRWRTAVAAVNEAEQNQRSGKSDGSAGRPAKAQSA
jgi:capsule polysaccharide export protein KpsE/RkpR